MAALLPCAALPSRKAFYFSSIGNGNVHSEERFLSSLPCTAAISMPESSVAESAASSRPPRRHVLAVAAAAAAMAGVSFCDVPEAHAARRKPPEEEKKKKKKEENKELSGYQAKLLDSMKRKDSFKESINARKAKADSPQ